MAFGSTYPTPCQEEINPPSDAMSLIQDPHCLIFSCADGLSIGKYGARAASLANQSFIEEANRYFDGGVRNWEGAFRGLMSAVRKSHLKVKEKNWTTAHLGIFAFEQYKSNESKKNWKILISVLGHLKVFLFNPKKGKCYDLTKKSRGLPSDPLDTGGRLGNYSHDSTGSPDLRNFSIYYFDEIDEGCFLLPMSDGVYANFDPENLGLTPVQIFDELKRKEFLPGKYRESKFYSKDDLVSWENYFGANMLKELFQCMRLAEIIKEGIESKANISEAIGNHVIHSDKLLQEEDSKGFQDNFSIACIELRNNKK